MFNAVQKENQPLAERVAEQIAQLIQERELKEGDRLPNEFDLAQELGVGRGTIREAVNSWSRGISLRSNEEKVPL